MDKLSAASSTADSPEDTAPSATALLTATKLFLLPLLDANSTARGRKPKVDTEEQPRGSTTAANEALVDLARLTLLLAPTTLCTVARWQCTAAVAAAAMAA